jgi:hypothetical protein
MMDFSYRSAATGVHRIRGKFTRPHEKQAMRVVVSVLDFPEPGRTAATGLALSDIVYADMLGEGKPADARGDSQNSDPARTRAEINKRRSDIGRALARAAAEEVVKQLDDGTIDGLVHTIMRDNAEWLAQFRHRSCEFQRKGARAPICTVARDEGETHVSQAECEACPLPEYWARCRYLTEIQTYREQAEKQRRNLRCQARCARGQAITSPKLCRPGGLTCFSWGLFTRSKSGLVVPTEEAPLRRVPGGPRK